MNDVRNKLDQASKCSERRDYTSALKLCGEVIESHPENPSGYRKRSHVYARIKKWDAAISDRSQAIRVSSGGAQDYFFRGYWRLVIGDYENAIQDLTEAIDIEEKCDACPYSQSAYFYRAEAWLRLENYDAALDDCKNVDEGFSVYFIDRLKSKSDVVREAEDGLRRSKIKVIQLDGD